MSERGKQILEKIADGLPKLDFDGGTYITGVADGMAIAEDLQNSKAATEELPEE